MSKKKEMHPLMTGRKKGQRSLPVRKKPKELVRGMLEDKSPLIMQKVITLGLEGDVQCLKMLVDRILPAHKSVDVKQTKTDYAININVGSIEQLPEEVVDVIDVTPTEPVDKLEEVEDADKQQD